MFGYATWIKPFSKLVSFKVNGVFLVLGKNSIRSCFPGSGKGNESGQSQSSFVTIFIEEPSLSHVRSRYLTGKGKFLNCSGSLLSSDKIVR